MGDENGPQKPGDEPIPAPPARRREKRRNPTLIGMAVANPNGDAPIIKTGADAVSPPSPAEPPSRTIPKASPSDRPPKLGALPKRKPLPARSFPSRTSPGKPLSSISRSKPAAPASPPSAPPPRRSAPPPPPPAQRPRGRGLPPRRSMSEASKQTLHGAGLSAGAGRPSPPALEQEELPELPGEPTAFTTMPSDDEPATTVGGVAFDDSISFSEDRSQTDSSDDEIEDAPTTHAGGRFEDQVTKQAGAAYRAQAARRAGASESFDDQPTARAGAGYVGLDEEDATSELPMPPSSGLSEAELFPDDEVSVTDPPRHDETFSEATAVLPASLTGGDEPDIYPPALDVAHLGASPDTDASTDLPPVPTVMLDASGVSGAPTYSVNTQSGHISETPAVAYDDDVELPKSRAPLFIAVALVALFLVGGGLAALFLVLAPGDADPVVVEGDQAAVETAARPAESTETAATDQPAATDQTAEDTTPTEAATDEEGDEELTDGEGDEELTDGEGDEELTDEEGDEEEDELDEEVAPVATGSAASVESLRSFELDLPARNRRARRMTTRQRAQFATRLRNRGRREYRRRDYAAAESTYRDALSYNDWDVASIEGMARSCARLGRFPEAVAWGELAVTRNPRSSATFRILGDVWRQAGHPEEAERVYRRGLVRHPSDRWLRQRLEAVNE